MRRRRLGRRCPRHCSSRRQRRQPAVATRPVYVAPLKRQPQVTPGVSLQITDLQPGGHRLPRGQAVAAQVCRGGGIPRMRPHRVQGGLSQGQATPPCFTHEEQAGQELDRSGWWWLVEGVVRRRTPVRPTIHQEHSIFDACERAWPRCCTSLWTCVLAGYCRILMLTHSLTH